MQKIKIQIKGQLKQFLKYAYLFYPKISLINDLTKVTNVA